MSTGRPKCALKVLSAVMASFPQPVAQSSLSSLVSIIEASLTPYGFPQVIRQCGPSFFFTVPTKNIVNAQLPLGTLAPGRLGISR